MRYFREFLAFAVLTLPLFSEIKPTRPSDYPVAFVNARILADPEADIITDGVIIVRDGKITAVGSRDTLPLPSGVERIDCKGGVITAGFWNSHVHFIEPKWAPADSLPAEALNQAFRDMLTGSGFTSVVDTGSMIDNTVHLRQRVESGEVSGPRIFTAGIPLYPTNGIPFYLTESLPPAFLERLYTPATPADAERQVDQNIDAGADLIKLFLVTGVRVEGNVSPRRMDLAIVKAAVARAHARGKKVFVHPSDQHGIDLAIDGGIDVLAHSIEDVESWNQPMIGRLLRARITLVPTVTLFIDGGLPRRLLGEAKTYADAGGRVAFGTDIGYLTAYDKLKQEVPLLAEGGMTARQILASLTTTPASLFGSAPTEGRVAPGAEADLVVLADDPLQSVTALSRVRLTIRHGVIIYKAADF